MNRRTVVQTLLAFFGCRGWGMQQLAVPPWTEAQRQAWREQWVALYGMQPRVRTCLRLRDAGGDYELIFEVVPVSQIDEGSVYHVPKAMVGILDRATFKR